MLGTNKQNKKASKKEKKNLNYFDLFRKLHPEMDKYDRMDSNLCAIPAWYVLAFDAVNQLF